MHYIYVLKCKNNKYYVGKTQKPVAERFNEHQNGQGAEWTRIHRPLKIVEFIEGDRFDEDKYTKMYMEKFGIENVRGGRYTSIHLNTEIIEHLENELIGCNDKCFTCHETGHFSRTCPNAENIWMTKRIITKLLKEKRCLGCGRKGHYASSCYAKTYDNSLNDHEIEVLSNIRGDCEESDDEWEDCDEWEDESDDENQIVKVIKTNDVAYSAEGSHNAA